MSTSAHRRPGRLAALVAAVGVVTCLSLPAGASASRTAEISIMDDQLLLGAAAGRVGDYLAAFKAIGVDRLRVSAFWSAHAPAANRRRKPRGFNAANPSDQRYNWTTLDHVVQAARTHGLELMISITTPAPLWASAQPSRRNPVWLPKPDEFADFAAAVARRYGDATQHYGMLNEPNQGSWLQPQSVGGELVSPHLYRALASAAYPRIKAADRDSVVLIGELAPSGRDARGAKLPVRPLEFLRTLGCRDGRMRRTRDGPCRTFKPVRADAIGHHPYAFFSRPDERSRNRDDVALADSRRLLRTLDALTARRAIRATDGHRLEVYYTEFGYQTDPPDPFAGIPLARQDRYLQEAAYIVWKTPRIQAINQFRLTDGRIGRGGGYKGFNEFQSGLLFRNFREKPAAKSFPHPLVLIDEPRRGRKVRLWGQVRPGDAHQVIVEFRSQGGQYREIGRLRTNSAGYFMTRVTAATGDFRIRYGAGGADETSQALHVVAR